MSALLEVADHEFSRLREQADAIRAGYATAIRSGFLDVELVADSLDAYLTDEQRGRKWLKRALKAGFIAHENDASEGPDEKTVDMRSAVLRLSEALGLETLEALDQRLQTKIDGGAIEKMAEAATEEAHVLGDTTIFDLLANLLLFQEKDTPEIRAALDSIDWVEAAKGWFRSQLRSSGRSQPTRAKKKTS